MPHGYKCTGNVTCEHPCLKLHFAISLFNKMLRNLLLYAINYLSCNGEGVGLGSGEERPYPSNLLKGLRFLCLLPRLSLTKYSVSQLCQCSVGKKMFFR